MLSAQLRNRPAGINNNITGFGHNKTIASKQVIIKALTEIGPDGQGIEICDTSGEKTGLIVPDKDKKGDVTFTDLRARQPKTFVTDRDLKLKKGRFADLTGFLYYAADRIKEKTTRPYRPNTGW